MRIADISSLTMPMLASKVETTTSGSTKGKEIVQKKMQISDDERSDSIKTNEELPIQFSSILRDFSVNMALTLPVMFKANESQSLVIKGVVEEKDALMAKIVDKKDELEG